jgi:hypothetical protein
MPAIGCHGILFSSEDWVCGARYARTKIAPPTHQISAPMLQTSSDDHFGTHDHIFVLGGLSFDKCPTKAAALIL